MSEATRIRFSDTGEELMGALRKQRVSHRTLVTVEAYLIRITKEYRVSELARLRAIEEAARALCQTYGPYYEGDAAEALRAALGSER